VRQRAGLALAAIATAALAHRALWAEPRRLELPEHTLELDHWPPALDGLRVALVSDLHAGGPHVREDRLEAVVDAVHAARPDLVLLLGDYVDTDVTGSRRIPPDVVAGILARLRAPAGTVAVLGNHDWLHEGRLMADALRGAGVTLLENAAVRVRARGEVLWLAGLADYTKRQARVGEALSAVPDGEPVLLLSHNPDVFPYVPERVALTLSGHTHGAQIDLPVLSRRVIPSRFGNRYKGGHVVEHGRQLFVSRGIGESSHPIRFNAPPEVPVLRLASRACPS
jgi:predicted MPP superfamily phosphohydrolase